MFQCEMRRGLNVFMLISGRYEAYFRWNLTPTSLSDWNLSRTFKHWNCMKKNHLWYNIFHEKNGFPLFIQLKQWENHEKYFTVTAKSSRNCCQMESYFTYEVKDVTGFILWKGNRVSWCTRPMCIQHAREEREWTKERETNFWHS